MEGKATDAYPLRRLMTEEFMMKVAQPFLIGVGLVVVLNVWNIIHSFWNSRQKRDESIDAKLKTIENIVVRNTFDIENLQKDINNVGKILRERTKQNG